MWLCILKLVCFQPPRAYDVGDGGLEGVTHVSKGNLPSLFPCLLLLLSPFLAKKIGTEKMNSACHEERR